jgi:hypothetical protein
MVISLIEDGFLGFEMPDFAQWSKPGDLLVI